MFKTENNLHSKAPVWVFDSVGSSQVSSQVVSQQQHFLQANLLSPLLQGSQELVLSPLRVCAEQRAAAPAKAQHVHGVDWPAAGQRVEVLGPEGNATSKAMQQN